MIRLDSISRAHGRQILLMDASMAVHAGEKVGLVGPNGAGKSTIFRMIVGQEPPDGGDVIVDRGVTIGYFDQQVGEMAGRSVLAETVAGAGEVSSLGAELAELETAMADPERGDELDRLVTRYGEVQARFQELDGYGLDSRAREILAGLGFDDGRMNSDVGDLSGGWKMRVALARILLMQPDALLLDEPTNHLDIESILWLEQFLRNFAGAVVITSHDRTFLNRLVTRVVDIDGGDLVSYSGDYEFYVAQRELADAQRDAQAARQQAMLAKEKAFIARFQARASHAAQVQSRVKKLEKIDVLEPPRRRVVPEFAFRDPPRSGDDVVRLEGVGKAYGPRVLYRDLDLTIRRQERWCVMGVNGAGKSTLLKLVTGAIEPDAGTVTPGASLRMGYFAQHSMELLDAESTVLQTLEHAFPQSNTGTLRNLAAAFLFTGDDVDKQVRFLSGGEKARLVLARMLYDPPNFLVLDEPTNHLDMDTKAMLRRALGKYSGTMLLVSHDREFLADTTNRVLHVGDGEVHMYGRGYADWVEATGQEAPGVRGAANA
ncbi:MAG: ABC transporter ATP-binding protein [Deltaproteobacteria bacterium]|nr:MAG: ABC transporter ATP-binding protein [Deltaproteobacteria bacterium]